MQLQSKKVRALIILVLILTQSCGDKFNKPGESNEQKLNYFLGFWQNVDKPHNFICFSYAVQDVKEGKCSWGTFPLEPDARNNELIDSASYYQGRSFMGGLTLEKNKIPCWYKDLENQGMRMEGEIKIIGDNKISTPVGIFRKLSKDEITKINPNLE